ncbi:SRPBCC family protein [Tsukamurella spumae]|uniref:SRPBCC family protein n=1 Tax=Tsukamurella spumae TaxID=44753 RepID=A0A846X1T0_9ACTN|nr:SRPBCC family protein [Tsukamurella spumae]NKY18475.1 SRPBCC family protein [Tsukamurella spumae]
MATPVLESSVVIDAPVEKVWAVVSDLEAMGRRSPQCKKVFVFGGPLKVGSRMLNINRQGWKVWPTNTRVTEFTANERVAFRVAENHTVWSFTLVPDGDKTTVVERREAAGGRTTALSSGLVSALLGGNEDFERGLLVGMKQTLSHIKTEAEAK